MSGSHVVPINGRNVDPAAQVEGHLGDGGAALSGFTAGGFFHAGELYTGGWLREFGPVRLAAPALATPFWNPAGRGEDAAVIGHHFSLNGAYVPLTLFAAKCSLGQHPESGGEQCRRLP